MTVLEDPWTVALDALGAWVAACRDAGDDPDRLEALPPPPPPPPHLGELPPALRARAVRLAGDMAALEADLDARRREVGRALAAAGSSRSPGRPAATPRFLDESL